jgi:putative membrane protein
MGAADVVPGVSGGTVALILGHYRRLVTAISRIDRDAMRLVRQRQYSAAWAHVDGRFLAVLLAGILLAVLALASVMHWLLEEYFSEVMAVFFGLVLASGLLVSQWVQRWQPATIFAALLGAAAAWVIASMSPIAGEPSTPYLFACGAIAICAMILPGISGAFVLLLLGAYHPVTGMVDQLRALEITPPLVWRLAVFAAGCLCGLLLFSRLLRRLLETQASVTFAVLLGLMLGSLRKLWPLQHATPETASLEFKERVFVPVAPNQWEGSWWHLLLLAALSAGVVLTLHRLTLNRRRAPPQ